MNRRDFLKSCSVTAVATFCLSPLKAQIVQEAQKEAKITVVQIMEWGPCEDWPEDRVAKFVGEGMTPSEFLASEGLTGEEKEWLLVRKEVLSEEELRSVIRQCANETVKEEKRPPAADRLAVAGSVGTPDFVKLERWPDATGAVNKIKMSTPGLALDALHTMKGVA